MFKGEQIRQKRKEQGITAQQLADLLKVSKDNVYKWEKGTKPNNAEDYIKVESWLAGSVENVPQETEPSDFTRLSALTEVLLTSMAEVLSATSGENATVIRRRLEKAADDLAKIS